MKNPHAKTYTVTISGREREDGEKPFTWVVDAGSEFLAGCKALGFHSDDQDEDFENLEIEEIFEGVPDPNCGYYWNDMRNGAVRR
ncbi:hypothetical protein Ssi03_13060 [Sphaerisporangium siamense]|uniref:Uncharacterized protein n=1 Tax=Sphaerisporangium siamense TaxID=795645 RepID=A0A7W7GBK5_9ACTN|nr:hypothetical protein [Sphaerisporangium siamense]MBB4702925.1 hypothetical protein [Sphaerisporangium siamense]GII83316.1 hypothetical protein Ssi03_13060 [Sphaerisporangium siamense]